MPTLLPGEVQQAVADLNDQADIAQAEETTPLMNLFEHLNSGKAKHNDGHVVTGQGDDPPESTVEIEPTLVEDDDSADVFVEVEMEENQGDETFANVI